LRGISRGAPRRANELGSLLITSDGLADCVEDVGMRGLASLLGGSGNPFLQIAQSDRGGRHVALLSAGVARVCYRRESLASGGPVRMKIIHLAVRVR
jgi:hypothetical protein